MTVVVGDTAREMLVVKDYNEYLFSSDNQRSVIYVIRCNRVDIFKATKRNVHRGAEEWDTTHLQPSFPFLHRQIFHLDIPYAVSISIFYVFIPELFNTDFNSSRHIAPDGRMVREK
jgi:hypothetical protein